MNTALTITPVDGRSSYLLLDDHDTERGSLQVDRTLRRGTIRTGDGTWSVRHCWWRRITVEDNDTTQVRLDPRRVVLPATEFDGHWQISRTWRTYQGTLTHGDQVMIMHLSALGNRRGTATVVGSWNRRDLVVLTAFFALLVVRRRVIIVAGSSH